MKSGQSKTITKRNCKRLTGLEWKDLFQLTGVFGFHTEDDILHPKKNKLAYFDCRLDPETIHIDLETDLIEELYVTININNKFIFNNRFYSKNKEKGLALRRVKSQIEAAYRLGYKFIRLLAAGSPELKKNLNGYCVWGKYGFIMCDHSEKLKFRKLMLLNKRKDKILYDLQMDIPEGQTLWEDYGFAWAGKFDIHSKKKDKKTLSIKLLDKSLGKKGSKLML